MSKIAEHHLGDRPYPETPGFKSQGTSRDAAVAIAGDAALLRERVFAAIAQARGGLTADQAAEVVRITVLACRPRCSELKAHGRIRQSGERRPNISGRDAAVWVVR